MARESDGGATAQRCMTTVRPPAGVRRTGSSGRRHRHRARIDLVSVRRVVLSGTGAEQRFGWTVRAAQTAGPDRDRRSGGDADGTLQPGDEWSRLTATPGSRPRSARLKTRRSRRRALHDSAMLRHGQRSTCGSRCASSPSTTSWRRASRSSREPHLVTVATMVAVSNRTAPRAARVCAGFTQALILLRFSRIPTAVFLKGRRASSTTCWVFSIYAAPAGAGLSLLLPLSLGCRAAGSGPAFSSRSMRQRRSSVWSTAARWQCWVSLREQRHRVLPPVRL